MRKRFAEWLDVRDDEGYLALAMFLCLFGIIAGHTILETARDALFLSALPPRQLTVVYAAVALATLLVAGSNTRFVEDFGRRNALVFTLVVGSFVTTVLHFQALTRPVLFLLYGWSALIGAMLTVQFWMYAAQLFTVAQGKRLFAPIASGAVLGGVFGASAAALVIPHIGLRALLLATAALFLATAVLLTHMPMDERTAGAEESTSQGPRDQSPIGFWAIVRTVPYLRELVVFTMLGTATLLVTDYLFKFIVASRVPTAELGGFFAKTYALLNVASLLVQFFLTRRILRRFGVVPALVILPLLLALGGASMALFGGALVLVLLTKGADGGLRYSLQRVANELLWLPLSSGIRARAKAIVDTVLAKITQAVVAGGLLLLVPLGLSSPRILALIALVLSILWLGTTAVLRRSYIDLFRKALSRGATDLELDTIRIDLTSLEAIFEALSSREPTRAIAAMELLHNHQRTRLIPALILYHDAEDVLVRALVLVATPDRKDWVPLAARMLHHPAERVRVEVVRALSRANEHELVLGAGSDPSLSVRAHAALMSPTSDVASTAVRDLLEVKGGEAPGAWIALLDAIADHPDPRWNDLVVKLAVDAGDNVEIADHAARAMTYLTDPRFIPWLVPRLAVREGRSTVRDALVHQGEDALDALGAALLDPSTEPHVRLHIPRTISRFSSQRAADLLLEVVLGDPRGSVRYKALRGLGRLVTSTTLLVSRVRVDPEIRKNLVEALRVTALKVALGSAEGLPPSGSLLFGLLEDKRKQAIERAFRFLQIAHRNEEIQTVYSAIVGNEKARRAQALEFLDALTVMTGRDRRLDPKVAATRDDIRELILLIGDDLSPASRVARATRFIAHAPRNRDEALARLSEEGDPTVATVAAFYARELARPSVRPRVDLPPTGPEAEIATSGPSLPGRAPSLHIRQIDKGEEIARQLFLNQLMGPSPIGSVAVRLARQMTGRAFAPGAVLYEAGTPSTSIFFIKGGAVEEQNPGKESRVFEAPAVVGGFDAMVGRAHIRSLVAVSEVEALILDRAAWLDAIEDQFEFACRVMELFCQRLGQTILATPPDGAFLLPTPAREAAHGLNLVERLLLLGSVTAFEAATIQSIAKIAQIATEIEYAAGDTIESRGSTANGIFVVASGQIEVTHEQAGIVGRMGPGQIVGGPASLGFKKYLFDARALSSTVLLFIRYDGLLDVMEDHFDLTFSALFTLGNDIERTFAAPRSGPMVRVVRRPTVAAIP